MTETCLTREVAVPMPAGEASTGGEHISLLVADPMRTAAWWCHTLGFELADPSSGPRSQLASIVVRHPDSGLVLRLKACGTRFDPWAFLSLRVDTRQAVEDWATHLHDLGVPHSAVHDTGDERSLTLVGPDRIGLELWWHRTSSTAATR